MAGPAVVDAGGPWKKQTLGLTAIKKGKQGGGPARCRIERGRRTPRRKREGQLKSEHPSDEKKKLEGNGASIHGLKELCSKDDRVILERGKELKRYNK